METIVLPELGKIEDLEDTIETQGPWVVILYNCDCHTFDDVILQLQKAAGYSIEKADHIAMEAHVRGRAIAYTGEADDCERVAAVLRSVRLQVETVSY
jgi:ATP-dependent Clp protease adapter protein ClpS